MDTGCLLERTILLTDLCSSSWKTTLSTITNVGVELTKIELVALIILIVWMILMHINNIHPTLYNCSNQ